MSAANELFRVMDAAETEALGPMPDPEQVSPTTDRVSRAAAFTAEVHEAGTVESSAYPAGDDDRFPPPRSLSEEG
jgi:hypothetical protein